MMTLLPLSRWLLPTTTTTMAMVMVLLLGHARSAPLPHLSKQDACAVICGFPVSVRFDNENNVCDREKFVFQFDENHERVEIRDLFRFCLTPCVIRDDVENRTFAVLPYEESDLCNKMRLKARNDCDCSKMENATDDNYIGIESSWNKPLVMGKNETPHEHVFTKNSEASKNLRQWMKSKETMEPSFIDELEFHEVPNRHSIHMFIMEMIARNNYDVGERAMVPGSGKDAVMVNGTTISSGSSTTGTILPIVNTEVTTGATSSTTKASSTTASNQSTPMMTTSSVIATVSTVPTSPITTTSTTTTTTTTTTPGPTPNPDWENWCMIQCQNGHGGSACNCDIIP